MDSPLADIGQGDAYGDAYLAARDHHLAREADIAAHDDLCADLQAADVDRLEAKRVAREKLRRALRVRRSKVLGLF